MDLIKPQVLAKKQQALIDDFLAGQADVQGRLRRLVSCDGYSYAKHIANVILKDYECKPPTKDEEVTKWETYCQMKWAIDKLFGTIQMIAAAPEPEKTVLKVGSPNANNRSSKFNTRPDASARARRSNR